MQINLIQRPTRRELVIGCLCHRLWEASPELIGEILQQLPDELIQELAKITIQVLDAEGSNETQNSQVD
ncbi:MULTISPECIES: hypothetical protein [Cyanophyceae]|uniref:hypothetical protein n=1 Tax=Cyanophyceae TaxID=3028117 RepID=UPI0016880AFF|nr:hypothetical protein [Trichocoleus sp. FACHB-832]MBD1908345.1 hypothetical protein [Trichocoleus sp. FACHB-832]